MANVRIGISGWRYEPWRGVFYPPKLAQRLELHYASRQLPTIELNGSFYSLQTPASYQAWYEDTPDDFVFAVKGPRYLTHIRRLKDPVAPLANFFGSGVLYLQEKLGPFLWQFPPQFLLNDERLRGFFEVLPRTVGEAVRLAGRADRVEADYPRGRRDVRLRHAIEVRHHSFENPDFISLLREYDVALVFADTAGRWPYMEDVTSDFCYMRLHGNEELYASGYGDEALRFWAARVRRWRDGGQPADALVMGDGRVPKRPRDVFVYFDNDVKVHAPFDAHRLAEFVGGRADPLRRANARPETGRRFPPVRGASARWKFD